MVSHSPRQRTGRWSSGAYGKLQLLSHFISCSSAAFWRVGAHLWHRRPEVSRQTQDSNRWPSTLRASGRRPNQLSYLLLLIYNKLGKFITKGEPNHFGATFHQLSSLVLFNIWVVIFWTLSHMWLNPSRWPSVFARSSGTPMSETLWVVLNCFPVSSHSPFLAVMENICIASYLFTSALYKLVFWDFRISSHRVYSTRRKFCFLALWQTL